MAEELGVIKGATKLAPKAKPRIPSFLRRSYAASRAFDNEAKENPEMVPEQQRNIQPSDVEENEATLQQPETAPAIVNNDKNEAYAIIEARRNLQKHFFRTKKDKELGKRLSREAFELGADMQFSEQELDEVVLRMISTRTGLPIGKRKRGFRSYYDCFSGTDAVRWIMDNLNVDEDEATQKGQMMFMNRGVIYSISKRHTSFHNRKDIFYRFKMLDDPESSPVLNEAKVYLEEVSDPCRLSEELSDMIINLMLIPHAKNDLSTVYESTSFKRFLLKTSALQKVQVESMTNEEKIVFFVNIHNVLLVHSSIILGPPTTKLEMKNLATKSYRIGRHQYSLQLIKLILSGQLPNEILLPKDEIELQHIDRMIYFCLFNGTDQSPALRSYNVQDFPEMAKQQAKQFITDQAEIRYEFNQIWLPKMFSENKEEFGPSDRDLLLFISKFLPKYHRNYITNNIEDIDIKYKDRTFKDVQYVKESVINHTPPAKR